MKEILALAETFHASAKALRATGRAGKPISYAPFRLLTIHAIELYLNAMLRTAGIPARQIRGYQHDLHAMLELADSALPPLRTKTRTHLKDVSARREYLLSRYAPACAETSQINRLEATLEEIRRKVTIAIAGHFEEQAA